MMKHYKVFLPGTVKPPAKPHRLGRRITDTSPASSHASVLDDSNQDADESHFPQELLPYTSDEKLVM